MTLETHVDYETYSELDLSVVGQYQYAQHPSTRMRCVSWATGNEDPHIWWPGKTLELPARLVAAFKSHDLFAFGASFEATITEFVASKLGFPVPKLEQWNCVRAVACMCALPPQLGRLAKALKLKELKDEDGERLIKVFSVPQVPRRKRGQPAEKPFKILPKDRPEDFKKFTEYCRQDVRVEREAHNAMPIKRLPAYEQKVWQADFVINRRGVRIDRAMAEGAMKLIGVAKKVGSKLLSDATNGKITSAGQGKRFKAFAAKHGYELINLKKETVEAVFKDKDLPKVIRKILKIREDFNVSSVAKFRTMLKTADPRDDRVRGIHDYHRAGPGRWGGRDVQFQNIPRPRLRLGPWEHEKIREADAEALMLIHGPKLLITLRDTIRNAVIPAAGHEFFVVDKASIEARVLGWVAGCKGYLKAFKDNQDLYVVCAAGIFGVPYEKILKGYKADIEEFVEYRKTGKDSVLALGYGQGDGTNQGDTGGFLNYCLKKGGKMTPALAKRTVRAFRKKLFPEIPKLWYETEMLAKRCVRTGQPQKMGGAGRPNVTFEMIDTYLTIKLPSGRRLWYPGAHLKMITDKWGNVREQLRFWGELANKWWRVEWTYGGKLVENIIQAIARDLLARALLKCEAAGLAVVMHVHDEIVAEVLKKLRRLIDEMHAIFRSVPKWGDGLLLGSGGFVADYYHK